MTEFEIQELRNRRFELWTDTKKYLDEHTDANGQISDEVVKEFTRREKKLKEMDNAINVYEHCNTRDAELNKIVPSYTVGNHGGHKIDGGLGFLNNSYHKNFIDAIRGNFRNDAAGYLREGLDAKGGYLVPTEMNDAIVTKLTQENVMRQLASVITTESKHKIPILASQPAANWIGEGQEIPLKDETFSKLELDSYKLAAGTKISNELLQDSFYDLEDFFIQEFGKSLAAAEEDAFINGGIDSDTSNRPTGILTSLDSDNYVTSSSTNQFTIDDLIDTVYSLPRPYRQNASWLMHDSILQKIRQQKNDFQYFLTPSIVEGEPEKILGYPVFTSSFMPEAPTAQTASGKPICLFGDFSRYYIADRGTRTFKPLYELFAISDLSAYLMIERIDGKLIDKNSMRLLKYKNA